MASGVTKAIWNCHPFKTPETTILSPLTTGKVNDCNLIAPGDTTVSYCCMDIQVTAVAAVVEKKNIGAGSNWTPTAYPITLNSQAFFCMDSKTVKVGDNISDPLGTGNTVNLHCAWQQRAVKCDKGVSSTCRDNTANPGYGTDSCCMYMYMNEAPKEPALTVLKEGGYPYQNYQTSYVCMKKADTLLSSSTDIFWGWDSISKNSDTKQIFTMTVGN